MKFEDISQNLRLGIPEFIEEIQGGNSSVIKAVLGDSSLVAVKLYKGTPNRIERMLSRESAAINFLAERHFRNIPKILETRSDLGLIIYKWIEGESPKSDSKSMSAIISMCLALDELEIRGDYFENAVDAAFSTQEIKEQIRERINTFKSNYKTDLSRSLVATLELKLENYQACFKENQSFLRSTISISDLGTHNMIELDGSFTFIDFEFFGRDSVEKMVGDFLLHPRNNFALDEILSFTETLASKLDWDLASLGAVLPILSLKWATIALGRTFKEIDFHQSRDHTNVLMTKSNGIKYLEFYEYLMSAPIGGPLLTFRLFADKI